MQKKWEVKCSENYILIRQAHKIRHLSHHQLEECTVDGINIGLLLAISDQKIITINSLISSTHCFDALLAAIYCTHTWCANANCIKFYHASINRVKHAVFSHNRSFVALCDEAVFLNFVEIVHHITFFYNVFPFNLIFVFAYIWQLSLTV